MANWCGLLMLLVQMQNGEFKYGGNSFKKNKHDMQTEQTNT